MNTSARTALNRRIGILFTSVGNEAIHGFVDDLRRRAPKWFLVGTDLRPEGAGMYRCDRAYAVPRRTSSDYLEVLCSICDRENVDLVFPLSTEDQFYFSDEGVQRTLKRPVVVSSTESIRQANSKIALFEALSGLPNLLPEHQTVSSLPETIDALGRLSNTHDAALMKLDTAAGGAGMLCVGTPPPDSAPSVGRRWHRLSVVQKALELAEEPSTAALPLAPELGALIGDGAKTNWPRQIVAYLPGSEYSVDVLSDRGTPLGGVVRLRSASVGGLATEAETVDEPDVLNAAYTVAQELKLSYVSNIQFRRDTDGAPKLLEINPRLPGTIALTVASGLNLPLAAVCLALGETLDLPKPQIGLRVSRYQGCVFHRGVAGNIDAPWSAPSWTDDVP